MTFLLTVFNARLGVWLGNPGVPGDATWTRAGAGLRRRAARERAARAGPPTPIRTCYLSDGGHFENLGLYEMVLRRCRFIVVSDAGCDGGYTFGDLANAVRKIRIDFGIDIDFPGGLHIGGRDRAARVRGRDDPIFGDRSRARRTACSCTSSRPSSVTSQSTSRTTRSTHAAVPSQSTTEQWFDEAQFESYRMLGLQTVDDAVRRTQFASVRDLCLARRQGQFMTMRNALIVGGIFAGRRGRRLAACVAGERPAPVRAGRAAARARRAPRGQNGLSDADRASFYHLSEGGELFPARLAARARRRSAGKRRQRARPAVSRQHRALRPASRRQARGQSVRPAGRRVAGAREAERAPR